VYFLTAAAGLTWRHGGDDGGDLATAVSLDGVPHPTGYPLYLLTGKLLLFLAPDPARALTLTTALWGALAVGLVSLAAYRFNRQLLGRSPALSTADPLGLELASLAGGWLAALSLAFAPLVWSQAVIIEIYSLNLLLLAGLLLALACWREKPESAGRLYLLAIMAGLAVGHHRTALFSLLAAGVFVFLTGRPAESRSFLTWKRLALAACLGVLAAGLPSLDLLIRGGNNPASNWADLSLSNPAAFWQYLSGAEYRNLLFAAPPGQALSRIAASAGLLLAQFGLFGLALGWGGLAIAWLTLPHYRPLAWLMSLGLMGHLAFAAIYAADNSQVYLLPFFTFWALAAGFGLAWLTLSGMARWPRYRRYLTGLVLPVALVLPAISLSGNYARLDLSQDRSAEVWARTELDRAPPGAILVSRQDGATFALWYVQYVERYRPEIVVIEARLLAAPWYRNNLARLYPGLKLPAAGAPDTTGLSAANPTRPVLPLTAPPESGLP
jgi:hypothetical protein